MTGAITVDPTALNSAGASVGAESNAVTSAISTLTAALSGHESGFGHDAAAFVFSRSYTNAANALLHTAASAVNASRRTGQGIQMSAYNYGIANAHSTVGGGESPVSKPGDPASFSAPGVPSVFGGAIAAPIGWGIVEAFVGGLWPDGDPAQMRATAAAWRTFGSSISGGSGAMTAAGTTLGGFQIPEAPQMQKAANDIGGGLTAINTQAQALAGQIDSFATTVENAQNAIRDLLHQLSPSGILSTIGGMFEGHNPLDKIKQIAHDIDTVLNNMKREANAMDQAVSQGINDLDGLTNKLEAWANKEFVQVFGPEVGGMLSMDFSALADITEGGFKFVAQTAEGLEQLDPTRFLYDPEGAGKAWLGTAKALGEMALVGDPFTAPLALANPGIRNDLTNLGKSMIDFDDFKNGHPLRGLAFNAAQVGTMIIPGVGEAAPAADAAGGAARVGAAEARAGGTVARDAGTVASRGGAAAAGAEEVASQAGKITSNLDKVGVPEAAPGPSATAGKAPIEPPAAAPKPEAAPAPKPEPAPSPAPTHEAPAPHAPQPTGPSEPHTPASVDHQAGSPANSHAPTPAEPHPANTAPAASHPAPEPHTGPASAEPHSAPPAHSEPAPQHAPAPTSEPTGPAPHDPPQSPGPHSEPHTGGQEVPSPHENEPPHTGGDSHEHPPTDPPNNPPHTGLHDPPLNHGTPGERLPDLTDINNEFRLPTGEVDPTRLSEWAQRISDEYPPITKHGVEGVYDYTTENYHGMNPYLRDIQDLNNTQKDTLNVESINDLTDSQRAAWEERIKQTDEGLSQLPPYRADPADASSTTWRGMRASDALLDQFVEGGTFSDPAYLSTSTDENVAKQFALGAESHETPTLLKIEGFDGVDVQQLSQYMREAEILFPRGTAFEVVSKTMGDDGVMRIILRQMER